MNPIIEGNLKSKTSWAALLLMALGGLEQSGLLALVPDEYKGMAISAVGALMLFLRNVTNTSIAGKSSVVQAQTGTGTQSGFARISLLGIIATAVLCAGMLGGCATTPDGRRELTSGGKVALAELAGIGVNRYFRENPRYAERAGRIRAVLTELQSMDDVTSVGALRLVVQQRIDALNDPYDRQDLTHLLNILSGLLTEYVGSGQLDANAMVTVHEFIGYVAAALPRPAA